MKAIYFLLGLILLLSGLYVYYRNTKQQTNLSPEPALSVPNLQDSATSILEQLGSVSPLSIASQRAKEYPGSDITIEQNLTSGSNYKRYVASYLSEGLKLYGLLTVPNGTPPGSGWPVIIFNHGYIPPEQYRTTERYGTYVDGFARNGYIVFKPDYRGHGNSEGNPEGGYGSPAYTTDVLNALSSLKKYPGADPSRIGMWGHSMGGNVTLRAMVVDPQNIKAAVIWGGVVGSYEELLFNWRRARPFRPSAREQSSRRQSLRQLVEKIGSPSATSVIWNSIDPTAHINDITAPVQLHTGLADDEVPPEFSESLAEKLKESGKTVELFTYPGADHNLSGSAFSPAMNRSVEWFDTYLKGE